MYTIIYITSRHHSNGQSDSFPIRTALVNTKDLCISINKLIAELDVRIIAPFPNQDDITFTSPNPANPDDWAAFFKVPYDDNEGAEKLLEALNKLKEEPAVEVASRRRLSR